MANRSAAQVAPILPRFIRAGEAYGYLGMCRDEFNKTVRPNVREFPRETGRWLRQNRT